MFAAASIALQNKPELAFHSYSSLQSEALSSVSIFPMPRLGFIAPSVLSCFRKLQFLDSSSFAFFLVLHQAHVQPIPLRRLIAN